MSFASAEFGWLNDDRDHPEGYVTEEEAEAMFIGGLQAMREMLARFVEQGGGPGAATIAQSLRANWNPSWGADPGAPEGVAQDAWSIP